MKKCLKVTIRSNVDNAALCDKIQAIARESGIEGTVQMQENGIIIIACGEKEIIDDFLDEIHKGVGGVIPEDVHVEPFLREKDYRGIFRILE